MVIRANSCNADTTLNVKWWDSPPFWSSERNGVFKGALYSVLQDMVNICCKNASLNYLKSSLNPREDFRDEYGGLDEADFFVPVARDAQNTVFEDEDENCYFIAAVQSPGLYYLVDDDISSTVITDVLSQTWPLILVILLSAAYAGLLIWALDTYWNPEQFPRNFLTGFSEGVWWAFVTMTTVGYGDKTPRSLPARLFSFVWVLIGVVILSLFTATMTTSLTSDASSFTLNGKTVGCIRDTPPYRHALIHGAKVKEFNSTGELTEYLKNDSKMDGIILDSFEMLHISHNLEEKNIRISTYILHRTIYGLLIKDVDEHLAKCYKYVARRHRNKIYRDMKNELREPTKENTPLHIISKLISPHTVFLAIAFGGFGVLFLFTFTLDWLYYRRKSKSCHVEMELQQHENQQESSDKTTMSKPRF